jgi:hypothetical protein
VDDVGFVETVMQDIPNKFAVNKGQVRRQLYGLLSYINMVTAAAADAACFPDCYRPDQGHFPGMFR